jgi:uncharacterized repeat protein (TIGR01451 family)
MWTRWLPARAKTVRRHGTTARRSFPLGLTAFEDRITPAVVDLGVTKIADVATAIPGDTVTYTITVTNDAASLGAATNAAVTDTLPAGLTAVSWTGNGQTDVPGDLNDTIATLAPGDSVVYTLTATVDASADGPLANTATVTPSIADGDIDPNPTNDSAQATVTVTPTVDVSVTKDDGVTTATPGNTVTYTIVVSNAGPGDATGVSVADTFDPSQFSSVSYTSTQTGGVTGNTATGSGDIADTVDLPVGASVTYIVTATVDPAATGTLSNTATATVAVGTTDTDATNDSATDSDTLTPAVDVSVTKDDGATSAVPGDTVTYTIVVTNAGPSTATGVAVADTLPTALTGATFTSTQTGGATGNTATGTGDIADTVDLPPGASITYTITGTIAPDATGTLDNTATVTAANDTDAANDSATDSDTLTPAVDVSVTKDDGTTTATPGTTVTYTVTVTNAGPSTATGVAVADTLPTALTGATFTSTQTGGATGNTATGTGDIADTVDLPPGATVTYTVTGTVDPSATGNLANTATVTAANDTDAANDTATDTDTLTPQVDVQVTKTDGVTTVTPGTTVTYTIVVTNAGPSTAAGVSVADTMPTGLTGATFTSTATGGATGNTATGTGDIADTVDLPPGATITYTVTGTVTATVAPDLTAILINTATATVAAGTTDTDTANNSATDTDTVVAASVDLFVIKTDGATTVTGGTVTYTIVVGNNGPATATAATLTDAFPAGTFSAVSFTSVATGGATGNTATGTGDITDTLTIPSGATVTYTVTATVAATATGPVVNTATVAAAAGDTDTDTTNDTATDTDVIGTSVALTATPNPAAAGQSVTFTATVTSAAGANPTSGTVQFVSDGTVIGSATLSGSNVATFTTSSLPEGANAVTAVFLGSSGTATSASEAVIQQVNTGTVPPVSVPTKNLAVGGATNGTAKVFVPSGSGQYGTTAAATLSPFGNVAADVRTAVADVDNDGFEDTILVTGPGTAIRLAVVSGKDGSVLVSPFDPFGGGFTGGGFVAAGDFDGDGRAEVVVTPDQGGGPRVSIYSLVGTAFNRLANYFTLDPNFLGGIRPAVGRVNADATPDLVVAAGFGGGPRVEIIDGTKALTTNGFAEADRLVHDFFVFDAALRNGAYVAVGDVNADGFGDLIAGAGPGGAPRVLALDGQVLLTQGATAAIASPLANFFVAGNTADRGGVRVATKDADGDAKADVVVGSGEGSVSRVRVYPGANFVGTGEPTVHQDLDPFAGAVLADGVFVG